MTDPQHKPGDFVNGHVLAVQPDGSQAWLPVAAEQHKPGDTVDGHRLTQQPDGSLVWLPVEADPTKKRKAWPWVVGGLAVLVLLSLIIPSAVTSGQRADNAANEEPAAIAEEVADEPVVEEPVKLAVPDVTGMPADLAIASLTALGFQVPYNDDLAATVLYTTPAAGTMYAEGKSVSLTVQAKPKLTLAQQNAVGQAESYLSHSNFSRSGLIAQLEYEGYSTEDATFAVDYVGADWNAQAAGQAASYLSHSSFSREGLYDQLIYEGYSDAEANAGLAAVGY